MENRTFLLSFFAAVLLLTCCTSSYDKDCLIADEDIRLPGITLSENNQSITIDDAVIVSRMFRSDDESLNTKSLNRSVSSTRTLESSDGSPLMHIVNYENDGGFVVVAATTHYSVECII